MTHAASQITAGGVALTNNGTIALNSTVSASDAFTVAAPAGTGVTGVTAVAKITAPNGFVYTQTIQGNGTGTFTPVNNVVFNVPGAWTIQFNCVVTWMNTQFQTGTVTDLGPALFTVTAR